MVAPFLVWSRSWPESIFPTQGFRILHRLVLGRLIILAAVAGLVLMAACTGTLDQSITNFEVDDCIKNPHLDFGQTEQLESLDRADCSEPDTLRVTRVFRITQHDDYPGDAAIQSIVSSRCPIDAALALFPTNESWNEADDREVDCFEGRYGLVDLPASLVPAGASIRAEEGALAPDFLLETLNGEARLSDYRGQPTVLYFWTTWCAPCRQEMPEVIAAYEDHRAEDLVVIGLNDREGESVLRPFTDDFQIDFPVLIDRNGEVVEAYRVLGFSTTYFIGRDGVIESVFHGPIGRPDLGEGIAAILD